MTPTAEVPRYSSALRWLEDPLPEMDYKAMGTKLSRDEREALTRYVKNIERLAAMHAPRGWNPALGLVMVGRQVVRKPDGNGFTRGEPFRFDPTFAELLDAFIFRLRKLYLAKDQVSFHNVRTILGRRAPRDHRDAEDFLALLNKLKRGTVAALAGEGAPVSLHGPDGAQVRADVFFDAWLHDEELHENVSSSPKRSWVWDAFPDQLTRAVFVNTAFSLFAVYGMLGRVAARVLDAPFAAPAINTSVPSATPMG